jgi:hypothetical protein
MQVAPQSTHYEPDLITTKLADYIETNGAAPNDSAKFLQLAISSPKIAMHTERSQPNHKRHYRCSSSRGWKCSLETTRRKWSLMCRPGRECSEKFCALQATKRGCAMDCRPGRGELRRQQAPTAIAINNTDSCQSSGGPLRALGGLPESSSAESSATTPRWGPLQATGSEEAGLKKPPAVGVAAIAVSDCRHSGLHLSSPT